ncbi:MAG: MarR family transcriptional regulator [bacterium]|nr:MarR family transcriptional regulator [bacterium]
MSPQKKMYDLTVAVNKLSRLFADYVQQEMEKSGQTDFHPTTAYVLMPLLEKEGITLSELAKKLHMKAPTITIIANRLEEKGLIRRERGKSDRRHVQVYLTKSGKRTARIIETIQNKAIQTAASGLTIDSISLTQSTIERIITNVHSTLN